MTKLVCPTCDGSGQMLVDAESYELGMCVDCTGTGRSNRDAVARGPASQVEPPTRESKCSHCIDLESRLVQLEQDTTALHAQNETLKKELSRALGSPGRREP